MASAKSKPDDLDVLLEKIDGLEGALVKSQECVKELFEKVVLCDAHQNVMAEELGKVRIQYHKAVEEAKRKDELWKRKLDLAVKQKQMEIESKPWAEDLLKVWAHVPADEEGMREVKNELHVVLNDIVGMVGTDRFEFEKLHGIRLEVMRILGKLQMIV